MKIIQVIPQLNSGGAERFVVDLCNELDTTHEVVLFVLFPIETHGFFSNELNARIKIISFNKKLGKDFWLSFKVFKAIIKEKPDVVHTHLLSFYYCILSMLLLRRFTKYFHTIHNDALMEAPGKIGVGLKKIFFRLGKSMAITISNESNRSYELQYGLKAKKIENGRNFSSESKDSFRVKEEMDSYRLTDETKLVINIARINPQKNHYLLINSIKKLLSDDLDLVLIIIGNGFDKEILKFVELNVSDRIKYLGQKKNAVEYLRYADVFCLSSLHEGMPITLIETFSVGCVPICTPAGGIIDMIKNGENGFISKGFELVDLIKSFKEYFSCSSEEIEQMRMNSMKTSEAYSIENCTKNYLNYYNKELVNTRPTSL